jgi:DNA-binding transcriptional regulator YhcF (GntR family)
MHIIERDLVSFSASTTSTPPALLDRQEEIVEVLRGRVLRGLESGTLISGDRLPSGRDLAAEFDVDHRVVLAAYRQLADERLIEMRTRGGVYVADRHGRNGLPPIPASWLTEVLTDGLAREIPAPDLHEWLRRCTETLRLRAVVVASTQDQLHGLCRELNDDFGLEAEGVLVSELTDRATPLPIRRADIIVTTAAHESNMRTLGAELKKPVQVIEVRPDLVVGEWAMLLRRPVYVVVATPEFGEMIRGFFSEVKGIENMRLIVLGRDDVSLIPDDAPTYVTQSVRTKLAGVRIPGRILPSARTISAKSAREIFTFIVESNIEAMNRLSS